MKKICLSLSSALCLLLSANYAAADSYKYVPYVGADYSYTNAALKGARPNYHTLGMFVGSEYGRYFATEAFFNQSGSDSVTIDAVKFKSSNRNYGLDVLGFLPLGCENKFSLIGTLGVGEYVFKTKVALQKHTNNHGYGYRFGAGAKYVVDNHWQIRALARYINFDRLENFDHAMEYSVGVEYHF